MTQLLKTIEHTFSIFVTWWAAQQNSAICGLEQNYATILKQGRVERDVLFSTTRNTILAHLYTPDVYAFVFGLSIISWTTGAFSESGYIYGPWQPVVILLAGILGGIIPLVIIVFLAPIHVLFRVSIWILTLVNAVLSAVIFSAIEPIIPLMIYGDGVLYFDALIWKIMVFYAISLFFIHLRMRNKVCLKCYIKRQNSMSIFNYLPADKRGELIALSAQDHYVKIFTSNGEHLARLSMKSAISLAAEVEGMRVHRSHWVAKKHIVPLEKHSERYFLPLRNGVQIPVAKAQVSAINAILDKG